MRAWGVNYSQFFYTLSPRPPYRLLATSAEFCLPSAADPTACDAIQFISGLVLSRRRGELLLTFGVDDCEPWIARIRLAQVWQMLRPLSSEQLHDRGGDPAACE